MEIVGAMELDSVEAALERNMELEQLLAQKKLYLVLDLDHTLLNTVGIDQLDAEEKEYILQNYFSHQRKVINADIVQGSDQFYHLDHWKYWTKLRPFVHQFLEEASQMFELYIHTMGEMNYALAMAGLLDPKLQYFQGRIISSHGKKCKDLDAFLGVEHATLILDDSRRMWPQHQANLLEVERYHFFSSSCKDFKLEEPSLTQQHRDESEIEGNLARILDVLRKVHEEFFKSSDEDISVTQVVRKMKKRVLQGCHVLFDGVSKRLRGSLKHQIKALGATCHDIMDVSVTHVISYVDNIDEEKSMWAKANGCFLVHPNWLQAAQYVWKRPEEQDYPITWFPIFYPCYPTVGVATNDDVVDEQKGKKRKLVGEENDAKRSKLSQAWRTFDDKRESSQILHQQVNVLRMSPFVIPCS